MGNCPWPNGDYTMMIDIGKHKSKYAYIYRYTHIVNHMDMDHIYIYTYAVYTCLSLFLHAAWICFKLDDKLPCESSEL